MADDDVDEAYQDDWWDSLAIDHVMESQLNAVEQQAEPSSSSGANGNTNATLRTQMQDLLVQYEDQKATIQHLKRLTQQQQGEIAVVRSNLNRAQQHNTSLQQQQQQLEQDFRQRIEALQYENQRHIERIETSVAFRRIEQDSNRTPWPSSARRRAPVQLYSSQHTPPITENLSPSRPLRARAPNALASSPLSLTRRKRAEPSNDEPESPSKARSKRAFPNFDNSFEAPSKSVPTQGIAPSSSSTPTPSPSSSPSLRAYSPELSVRDTNVRDIDTYEHVLSSVFALQVRYISALLCQPYRHAQDTRAHAPSQSIFMYVATCASEELKDDSYTRVIESLWQCVLRANSYAAFLSDCGPTVRVCIQARWHSVADLIQQVWSEQSRSLYGAVAASMCALADVLFHHEKLDATCQVLRWMTALGVAHPAFMPHLAKRSTAQPLMPLLIECVRYATVSEKASPHACRAMLVSVVRLCRVMAHATAPNAFHELHALLQTPGILLAMLNAHTCEPDVLILALRLCTMLSRDAHTLHMCLSAQFNTAWGVKIAPRLAQVRFPVVDVLSKHLVDRRGDALSAFHVIHMSILVFLTQAARWPDACVMLAESTPLLPAVIQCLSWDVSTLWNTEPLPNTPGVEFAERYVPSLLISSALERVCVSVQFLHDLYMPEAIAMRHLADKLVSPQAQAILNGVRAAFIVALGRIAFATEPEWLVRQDTPTAQRSRMRTQLECAAMLASDLIDSVLSPNETDEMYELLAGEAE